MFKVRNKYGSRVFTVYGVRTTETGKIQFLMYYGWLGSEWHWDDADEYEPYEEN